jgi:hypothetical protein
MPAKLNFKELAERIDIMDVAASLGLTMTKEKRCACPTCGGDTRGIQIFEETNSYRCYRSDTSGDCISLYAHVKRYSGMYRAARELSEQFGSATAQPTLPQKPERRTATKEAQPTPAPFDPEKFAAKLSYTEEVEALGINEEDATRLGIGYHPQRKAVYFPVRNPTGELSGFIAAKNGELILPPRWIVSTNVVRLKRA